MGYNKQITGTESQKKKLKTVRLREMKRLRRLNTFAGLYVPRGFGYLYKFLVLCPRAVLFILFPLNQFIFEFTCPTYRSYTEYKSGEKMSLWDKTTLSKFSCFIPLFIFIAWHYYGPLEFWNDPLLANLDHSGLVIEQIEFYQSLTDYRYIVNFFIGWIFATALMTSVSTFYWSRTCTTNDDIGLHGNWPLRWCDEDYSDVAAYYLGFYEFVRCSCYIVPFVMLCQILFHVKAYHLVVTRFVGGVDILVRQRLNYDSETGEHVDNTMRQTQRFLRWLFLLAMFIVSGLIATTLSITYRNATLPYLILNSSFLFLIALSLLLPIFCVNACVGDYWEIVHVLKIVCLLFSLTLVVGVFFLEGVQVVFQMFVGGCFMMSIFLYYMFESAYFATYSSIETLSRLQDQPTDAMFGVVDVFLPHKQKSMVKRNFNKTRAIASNVYRAYHEKNLKLAINALENTGEMVAAYNEMFEKMLDQCEGSELYDTLKPYLTKVQKIGNRAQLVGNTVQQTVSMMQTEIDGIDFAEVQELIDQKVKVIQSIFENPKHLADPKIMGQILDDLDLILLFLEHSGKEVSGISNSLSKVRTAFSTFSMDVDFGNPDFLKQLRGAAERQSQRMIEDLLSQYNLSLTQKDTARALVRRATASMRSAEYPKEELAKLRALFAEREGLEGLTEMLLDPQNELDNLSHFFDAVVKTIRCNRDNIFQLAQKRVFCTLEDVGTKYDIAEGQLGLMQDYMKTALKQARTGVLPLETLEKVESLLQEYAGDRYDSSDFDDINHLFERFVTTFSNHQEIVSVDIESDQDPLAKLPVMSETTPLLV